MPIPNRKEILSSVWGPLLTRDSVTCTHVDHRGIAYMRDLRCGCEEYADDRGEWVRYRCGSHCSTAEEALLDSAFAERPRQGFLPKSYGVPIYYPFPSYVEDEQAWRAAVQEVEEALIAAHPSVTTPWWR